MKKLLIPFITIVFLSITSCSEKINKGQDEEAIKVVITEATEAYRVKDYKRLATTWIQDKSAIKLTARKDSYNAHYGWSEISSRYKSDFERFQNVGTRKIKKVNWNIKTDNTCAWAIHHEVHYDNEGEELGKQIITHLLEKHDERWKIVYMSQIIAYSY